MEPISFIGKDILSVLNDLRSEEIVDYAKTEGDEFLHLKEKGFYLHSKNSTGKIFDCRIYFVSHEDYFPARDISRGKFAGISSFSDMNNLIGPCERELRALNIPGRPPTLPGKQYVDGDFLISAFSDNGESITFIHVKTEV